MALRINQDTIIKYADKVFLGVAAVFLVFAAAVLVLGSRKADATYADVLRSYTAAQEKVAAADQDEYISSELLAGDKKAQVLFGSKPDYSGAFRSRHLSKPQPWFRKGAEQLAPYKPLPPPPVVKKYVVRIPEKRVAPTKLMLGQFKGYWASGREKDGILGRDLFLVTGQATIDLGQQTLWSRKAANVEYNRKWDAAIQSTVPLGYDVQRRRQLDDGTWGSWEDRDTVGYNNVNQRRKLPIGRMADGDAKALFADERLAEAFRKKVAGHRANIVKHQEPLLHPPFYPLAGVEKVPWPYDALAEEAAPGADAGMEEAGDLVRPPEEVPPEDYQFTPPGGEFTPPGEAFIPPGREVAPGPRIRQPFVREATKDFVFHDLLAPSDIGGTFQYRVRIRFLNPIFGAARNEVDPEHLDEAWRVEVPGSYSEPSEPIYVEPLVRFFFVGRSVGGKGNFRLFRWIYGDWREVRSAAIGVGELVSITRKLKITVPNTKSRRADEVPKSVPVTFNTGASVVDVFTTTTQHHGVVRNSEKLVYRDARTNQLHSRLHVEDGEAAQRFASGIKAEKDEAETPRTRTERRPRQEFPDRRGPRRPREDDRPPETVPDMLLP